MADLYDDLACYFPMYEEDGDILDVAGGLVGVETGGPIASSAGYHVGARDFGISKYFEVADAPAISAGDFDYTIAYRFRPASVTGVQAMAAKGWQTVNDANREWISYLNGTSAVWTPQRGTSLGDAAVTSAATIGAWSLCVQSVRASDGLFSNRINNGTAVTNTLGTTGGGNNGNRSLFIGASPSQTIWYNGSICEFMMWKRLLTADEQTLLYQGRTTPFSVVDSPVLPTVFSPLHIPPALKGFI